MNLQNKFRILTISAAVAALTACNGNNDTQENDIVAASASYSDEHHIVLAGEDNFRDLGGYVGADNKRIASGKLFRSGELAELTEDDQDVLQSLNIHNLIDLRSSSEIESDPDAIPATITSFHYPLMDDTSGAAQAGMDADEMMEQYFAALVAGDVSDFMLSAYVVDDYKVQQWTEIFDLLEQGTGAIWHCTAGQDRAGMTSALVLASLGVSRDVIIKDYLKSNEYTYEDKAHTAEYMYEQAGSPESSSVEAMTEAMLIKQEYIEAFFADIDQNYGGIDNFLATLDVDLAAMQEHYLIGGGTTANVVYSDEHHIVLNGEDNFRDLGGYVGADNKRVLEGKLFRSGELAELTEDDQGVLQSLSILNLIDLRSSSEIESHPDAIPVTITSFHYPLMDETSGAAQAGMDAEEMMEQYFAALLAGDVSEFMLSAYVVDDYKVQQWTKTFDLLEQGTGAIWHCTAGQDRAGMTSALVLASLGVPRDVIIKDYLKSNEYTYEDKALTAEYMYEQAGSPESSSVEAMTEAMLIKQEYIEAFFKDIDQNYGGIDNFLATLDVDLDAMQEHYLAK
ncbi:tyrosine-protein phosphatase [Shewanella sp. Isolate11]|uniref:tyrosine-protein phosphatase n=1 Tax=Shewanella sp. Isolate11 TaxID=2908530 RepID=UPI001EFD01C5|nr:tyrosine-protein phosphatase [Shewanella sp. Isolate11]MCG9695918.1 tyrosine-protein phosphatase [Shewanella sp. Isolate11]